MAAQLSAHSLITSSPDYAQRGHLELIEELYLSFQADPNSVDPQWRTFFEGMEFGQDRPMVEGLSEKELSVYNLVRFYRDYGHLKANLDPLKLRVRKGEPFELKNFGLGPEDLQTEFKVAERLQLSGRTLENILAHLEASYCGTLTAQLAECRQVVRDWFRREFETSHFPLAADEKKEILQQLARTEALEKFIHTRYVGTKRFSIEGGDSLIPMLEWTAQKGTALRLEEIVIGMAHRGRINVLANFMNKGLDTIFSEFDGTAFEQLDYDGDVKYHLGFSTDKKTPHGPCHISLAFNPSHLEAVHPVVCGMARAKQRRLNDTAERKKVLPIIIHGDAAFVGQGVVAETLQLSQLPGYTVGGSIHIIANNQVGFTTPPEEARSTQYSSDASKAIKAPVLLVNGDDVEACVRAMDMALRFRQEFGEDVVIDLICYRRFGHNEGDEPAFTQPLMYEAIKKHPTPFQIYSAQLLGEKLVEETFPSEFYNKKMTNLQATLDKVRKEPPPVSSSAFTGQWAGLRRGKLADFEKTWPTAPESSVLEAAAAPLIHEPEASFQVHPKIQKLIQTRAALWSGREVDWAMAELLAYGTLCVEGTPVRISGQDCKRGTFTHRQAVYFDVQTGQEHCPLAGLNPKKGEFCIYNSPLSEMAVLGFEYGNACSDPTFLTVWEAQFGDFANGAQIIIDQFLSSGEEKWMRGAGLTLLLPHGYEGQGPEHSSARLERFLQLCAQGNMQVCNLTTPANLFHALRRQVRRDFRKPLVIMSPKSLLRHPKVISPVEQLLNVGFSEVLEDPLQLDPSQVERLILCSGKIFYELENAREGLYKERMRDTQILRIEQLYPFPHHRLTPYLSGLPKLKKLIWVQEEPKNMGAWSYIAPRLFEWLHNLGLRHGIEYVGRTERASPATGSPKTHIREQEEILRNALT